MAWICYLLSFIIFQAPNGHEWALVVLAIGMILHWKVWVAIIGGFFVGVNWNKLF